MGVRVRPLRVALPVTPRAFVEGAGRGSLVRRGSSAAFLVGLILGLDALRRGRWPTRREMAGYAGAALVFLLAAAIAPEITSALLVGVLAIQLLRAAPTLQAWMRRIAANLTPPRHPSIPPARS